jgi:hypothetical protein
MRISKRVVITMLALTTGALSMALATGAFAAPGKTHPNHPSHPGHPSHHGRHTGAPLIDESVAPSQPGDPTFHGVSPGMAPWELRSGNVRLKRDGKLDLHVTGLVIPTTGTPAPVTSITASLYCGADTNTTAAATSQPAPLSPKGDARIHDASFGAPSSCLAPVILVHPNGLSNLYIALDGWR